MKTAKRLISLFLVVVMMFGAMTALIGCGGKKTVIDNENTRLVLSTSELDGVFNPFYSSSAPDGSIVGMTQIGMLAADKNGKVSEDLENEACVVLDYEAIPVDSNNDKVTDQTVYRFVLKNDVKFSNGSPLTMRDVLFNLYVYLDPAYYGSSTIYSTDIVGLKEYRTQTTNEDEQEGFSETFDTFAEERIQRLVDCLDQVYDSHKNQSVTASQMITELTEIMNSLVEFDETYGTVVDDYNLADIAPYVSIGKANDRLVPVVENYLPENSTWVLVDVEEE